MGGECLICFKKIPTGMVFCLLHFNEYADQLDEPWYKGIKRLVAQQDRARAKDFYRLTSLEHMTEGEDQRHECAVQHREYK